MKINRHMPYFFLGAVVVILAVPSIIGLCKYKTSAEILSEVGLCLAIEFFITIVLYLLINLFFIHPENRVIVHDNAAEEMCDLIEKSKKIKIIFYLTYAPHLVSPKHHQQFEGAVKSALSNRCRIFALLPNSNIRDYIVTLRSSTIGDPNYKQNITPLLSR